MTAPQINEKHKLEPMHLFLSSAAAPHVISFSLGWEMRRKEEAVVVGGGCVVGDDGGDITG